MAFIQCNCALRKMKYSDLSGITASELIPREPKYHWGHQSEQRLKKLR